MLLETDLGGALDSFDKGGESGCCQGDQGITSWYIRTTDVRNEKECLKCFTPLGLASEAMICSYECTYCVKCAEENNAVCQNCNGDLQKRPNRSQ